MPWVFVPMKDVPGCDKPRGAAKKRYYSGVSEWGNLTCGNARSLFAKNPPLAGIGKIEGTWRTETT